MCGDIGYIYVIPGEMDGLGGETVRKWGFGRNPVMFQWHIRAAVRDPFLLLNVQIHLKSSVLHLVPISVMAHRP